MLHHLQVGGGGIEGLSERQCRHLGIVRIFGGCCSAGMVAGWATWQGQVGAASACMPCTQPQDTGNGENDVPAEARAPLVQRESCHALAVLVRASGLLSFFFFHQIEWSFWHGVAAELRRMRLSGGATGSFLLSFLTCKHARVTCAPSETPPSPFPPPCPPAPSASEAAEAAAARCIRLPG